MTFVAASWNKSSSKTSLRNLFLNKILAYLLALVSYVLNTYHDEMVPHNQFPLPFEFVF